MTRDSHTGLETGLIPITILELVRLLRDTVIHRPAETRPTASTGHGGDAVTSTKPAKPTGAGTPAQMPHHDYNELCAAVTSPGSPA